MKQHKENEAWRREGLQGGKGPAASARATAPAEIGNPTHVQRPSGAVALCQMDADALSGGLGSGWATSFLRPPS